MRRLVVAAVAGLAAFSAAAQIDPALVDKARREGSVTLYTSMQVVDSRPLSEAFEKKYGLKVSLWRASGEKVAQRMLSEARAGRNEVDVVETTGQPRTDTTFFCIDVEEMHNFVTAGGVVHNCRPPGNRDPKPEEIESCRPWLEAKLDLIKPKVIVTLGNFATKLLLNTTQGITKMRGQTYAYGDAKLVPTFHPSAALQGGGGEVIAKMRADLVRAKKELASC